MTQLPDAPNDLAAGNIAPAEAQPSPGESTAASPIIPANDSAGASPAGGSPMDDSAGTANASSVVQPVQPAQAEAAPAPSVPSVPVSGPSGFKFVTSVLVIVLYMITFVVQAFRVPSESMENTLLVGDFLLADKLHFASDGGVWDRILPYRAVRRGDIIVFRYPVDPSQYFVKRVVGMPGDHLRLVNKSVFINGRPLEESYAIHNLGFDHYRDDFPAANRFSRDVDHRWRGDMARFVNAGELVVPPDQYFVMGDNRDRSLDSRYWGFVPRASIMGRPLMIYLSVAGPPEPEGATSNDKLLHSGQMLAHFLQLARWDRMFRLVR